MDSDWDADADGDCEGDAVGYRNTGVEGEQGLQKCCFGWLWGLILNSYHPKG